MKALRWHPLALEDMQQLIDYCHTVFGIGIAKKVRDQMKHDVRLLKAQPYLGFVEPELTLPELEIRSLIIGPTKIIYSVHQEYVYIHLLWNTRRSFDFLKKEITKRTLF